MESYPHIEKLLARFLDGATTGAEERELHAFFAGDDIPEAWRPYREMFGWYQTGLSEEKPTLRPRKKRLALWGGAAAAIAVGILLFPPPKEPKTYVESYIIRNGVKITDPAVVSAALEESRLYWETVEREQATLARAMEIAPPEEFEY